MNKNYFVFSIALVSSVSTLIAPGLAYSMTPEEAVARWKKAVLAKKEARAIQALKKQRTDSGPQRIDSSASTASASSLPPAELFAPNDFMRMTYSVDIFRELGMEECKSSEVIHEHKETLPYTIDQLKEIHKIGMKENLTHEEQNMLVKWMNSKGNIVNRSSNLLGVPAEPISLDSLDGDSLPPPMSLAESRYGNAALVSKVTARATKLTAQGVEFQKGGLANLADIMIEGFARGYSGGMVPNGDPSWSALAHGPYWVILDLAKIQKNAHTDALLMRGEKDAYFTSQYHLAYLVPDEKYLQTLNILQDAAEKGVISQSKMKELQFRVMPYKEYLKIGDPNQELTEDTFKAYLQNKNLNRNKSAKHSREGSAAASSSTQE